MADIFISYAREDRSRIEPLAKSLEELGWSIFWDRTIPAGKTWRQVIGDALKNARSVIVAWSQKSIESDWVQEEADRGRKRNILIPILIDDVDPPLGFGTIQAADLVEWDPAQSSQEFQKLIADISAILGSPPKHVKETEQAAEEKRKGRKAELEAERARVAQAKHKAEPDVPIRPSRTLNKRSRGRDAVIAFIGFGAAMAAAMVGTSLLPTETRPPFGGDSPGVLVFMFVVAGILGAIASLVLDRNWKSVGCVIIPAILGWGIGLSQDPRYEGTQVGLTAGALAGIFLATLMKKLMKRAP